MNIERRKRLCDYGSLSSSPRLLFPFALRPLCDYCSLSPYALSAITLPFRLTLSLRLLFPSTNTPIPRFCAREARKWRSRRAKAHKNADFVLERGQNLGKVALSDTKTPILCSSRRGVGIGKRKMAFLQITAHASKT